MKLKEGEREEEMMKIVGIRNVMMHIVNFAKIEFFDLDFLMNIVFYHL